MALHPIVLYSLLCKAMLAELLFLKLDSLLKLDVSD